MNDRDAELILGAMRERARGVLETLRELPADRDAVRAWASRYGLDDACFVATAVETHAYWTAHPAKRATRMLLCPRTTLFGSDGPDLPESRTLAATLFPIPAGEPFEWWLARAEVVIKECKQTWPLDTQSPGGSMRPHATLNGLLRCKCASGALPMSR